MTRKQSKTKRSQIKKKDRENVNKNECRNVGIEVDSGVAEGSSQLVNGLRKNTYDTFHNAEQPSCSKCLKLLERSWKWESLDKKEQSVFLSEAQRDSKRAFMITHEDLSNQLEDIQCDADRDLVQEVVNELKNSMLINDQKITKKSNSPSIEITPGVRVVLKSSMRSDRPPRSSPCDMTLECAIDTPHLAQLIHVVQQAGDVSEISEINSNSNSLISLSELFFPGPSLFLEVSPHSNSFVSEFLEAHDTAKKEGERTGLFLDRCSSGGQMVQVMKLMSSLDGQMKTAIELNHTMEESIKSEQELSKEKRSDDKGSLSAFFSTWPGNFMNGDSADWNPKLGDLLQSTASNLRMWTKNATSLLLLLRQFQHQSMLCGEIEEKRCRAIVDALWENYEQAMDELGRIAGNTRRELNADEHGSEYSQSMGPCWGVKGRAVFGRLLKENFKILYKLHVVIKSACEVPLPIPGASSSPYCDMLATSASFSPTWEDEEEEEEGGAGLMVHLLPLFVTVSCFASSFETLTSQSYDWRSLEEIEQQCLNYRFTVSKDIGNGGELLSSGRESDTHLKILLGEWEKQLKGLQQSAVERANSLLSLEVFPQTTAGRLVICEWRCQFTKDLDSLEQEHSLAGSIAQQDISSLQTKMHSAKKELTMLRSHAKSDGVSGGGSSSSRRARDKQTSEPTKPTMEAVELNGLKVLNIGDDENHNSSLVIAEGDDGIEEQERSIISAINAINLKQLDACLKFRYIATRNLHNRQVLLRNFSARLDLWRHCLPSFTHRLCGGPIHATKKLKSICARLLLEQIDCECGEWLARRVEKQLVGDADREYAKMKIKSSKKIKNISKKNLERNNSKEAEEPINKDEDIVDAAAEDSDEEFHDASAVLPDSRSQTPEFLPPLNSIDATEEETSFEEGEGWFNIASNKKRPNIRKHNQTNESGSTNLYTPSVVDNMNMIENTTKVNLSMSNVGHKVEGSEIRANDSLHNVEITESKLNCHLLDSNVADSQWDNKESPRTPSDVSAYDGDGNSKNYDITENSTVENNNDTAQDADVKVEDDYSVEIITDASVLSTVEVVVEDIAIDAVTAESEVTEEEDGGGFSISFGSISSEHFEEAEEEIEISFGFNDSSDEDEPDLPPRSPPDKMPDQPQPIEPELISSVDVEGIKELVPVLPTKMSFAERLLNGGSGGKIIKVQTVSQSPKQQRMLGSSPILSTHSKNTSNSCRATNGLRETAPPRAAETAGTPDVPIKILPKTLGKGHNNCFMNVVVQAFYFLPPCRERIESMEVPSLSSGERHILGKVDTDSGEIGDDDGSDTSGLIDDIFSHERELCLALKEVIFKLGIPSEFSLQHANSELLALSPSDLLSSTSSKKRKKKKSKGVAASPLLSPTDGVVSNVVDVERLRIALVAVAAKNSKSKVNSTGLATLGEMADAVDALGMILYSLRSVMGDDFVDCLFTIRMREEYICTHCSTENNYEDTTDQVDDAKDEDLVDSISFPISPASLMSEEDLIKISGRLSPKLDVDQRVEDKMQSKAPGVVKILAHDAPALSIAVPCLKHAASISYKNDSFSSVLKKASEMSCDVVHCKKTRQCSNRPATCRRTLRCSPTQTDDGKHTKMCPSVFALELIHDDLKTRGDPVDIAEVLSIIQPQLDLNTVFEDKKKEPSLWANLCCFFCFQPHKHHYVAYCYHPLHGMWFRFDDNKVVPAGKTYRDVVSTVSAGGFMPHVLFYQVVSG